MEEKKDTYVDSNMEKEREGKQKSRYFIFFFFFTILLFFCVFGITYSIYYGDGGNSDADNGEVVFTYSDVGKAGNGILLENAIPTSDDIGKIMIGNRQYFDFSITATTRKHHILYKVLAKKDAISTLDDQKVKVYLTKVTGNYVEEKCYNLFSELKMENINGTDYYVLYEETLEGNLKDYSDSYRLRMWIKEDAKEYENQFFSVNIDVYAYQLEG